MRSSPLGRTGRTPLFPWLFDPSIEIGTPTAAERSGPASATGSRGGVRGSSAFRAEAGTLQSRTAAAAQRMTDRRRFLDLVEPSSNPSARRFAEAGES